MKLFIILCYFHFKLVVTLFLYYRRFQNFILIFRVERVNLMWLNDIFLFYKIELFIQNLIDLDIIFLCFIITFNINIFIMILLCIEVFTCLWTYILWLELLHQIQMQVNVFLFYVTLVLIRFLVIQSSNFIFILPHSLFYLKFNTLPLNNCILPNFLNFLILLLKPNIR